MSLSISSDTLHIIGIVYSAVGIALNVAYTFLFNVPNRSLDHLQWAYFLAYFLQSATTIPFSLNLEVSGSIVALSSTAQTNFFCTLGTYVCDRSFALSFMVILTGFLILMRLITIPTKVQEKGITFDRVYKLFKGLFKWFYLPLIFESLYLLIFSVDTELIPSVVLLSVLCVFPVAQLALYWILKTQTQDPNPKFIQFANYLKSALFALFLVLALKYSVYVYFYYIALLLISYAALYLYLNNFTYRPTLSKIVFISGEILFYFIYSLIVGRSQWLSLYYLDLFFLGVIILIDLIYCIVRGVHIFKQYKVQGVEVIPEESRQEIKANGQAEENKKNRYDVGEELGEMYKVESRENLHDSRVSSNGLGGGNNPSSGNLNSGNKKNPYRAKYTLK